MAAPPAPSADASAGQELLKAFMPTHGTGNCPEGQLFASVAGKDADVTTLAFGCPPTLTNSGYYDAPDCIVVSHYTATVGPSIFVGTTEAFYPNGPEPTDMGTIYITVNCEIDGMTAATCTGTSVRPSSFLDERVTSTATSVDTAVETTTFGPDDMAIEDITIVSALWTLTGNDESSTATDTAELSGTSGPRPSNDSGAVASKTGEESPAPTITGESGASHFMVGFSGLSAGVLFLVMVLL